MSFGSASKVVGMALAAILAAGCASSAEEAAPVPAPEAEEEMAAPSPELAAEGAQLFSSTGRCSTCHGDNAAGGRFGPDLTDDEWAWIDPAAATAMQDLVELIRTGVTEPRVSDTGMPPMGGANLSDDQLQALAAYILSL